MNIAIVGKYVEYEDSYKSLKEALTHGAIAQNLKLNVTWIEAEGLESKTRTIRATRRSLRGSTGSWYRAGLESAGLKGC